MWENPWPSGSRQEASAWVRREREEDLHKKWGHISMDLEGIGRGPATEVGPHQLGFMGALKRTYMRGGTISAWIKEGA